MVGRSVFPRTWRRLGATPARCRDCKGPILWRWTDQAKCWPFNVDALPIREDEEPGTGRMLDVWNWDALHFRTCKKKPKRTKAVDNRSPRAQTGGR